MKNVFAILFFMFAVFPAFSASHIIKLPKVDNPAITVSSADKSKTYYQENSVSIPWESENLDWSSVESGDVVVRLYNFTTSEGSEIRFPHTYLTQGIYLTFTGGESSKHFASFPQMITGKVTLYNPDTIEALYQSSINSGTWEIEPYVLDNYMEEYILIDITGGMILHEGVPLMRTDDAHLYALVKTEALRKGSVTVSLPTHVAYLSLKKEKPLLTKDDYYQLYHRNSRKLVAGGLSYNFSDSEDALYLRGKGVSVSDNEYDFLSTELALKQYNNNSHSLLDSLSGLTEEEVKGIYPFRFVELDGWGAPLKNSTTVLYDINILTAENIEEVFFNGEKLNILSDGGVSNSYELKIVDNSAGAVIEVKVPASHRVEWIYCSKHEGGFCYPDPKVDIYISAALVPIDSEPSEKL